jgi:hypothetical protein
MIRCLSFAFLIRIEGHEFQWANELSLRQLKRDGWMPVAERDRMGRPTIFMDRLKEWPG